MWQYKGIREEADWPLWRLPLGSFLRMRGYFFKNAWHFKDIFRAFKVFFEISIVFKDIFRVIEAFLN
jgi:hypothetical protein